MRVIGGKQYHLVDWSKTKTGAKRKARAWRGKYRSVRIVPFQGYSTVYAWGKK